MSVKLHCASRASALASRVFPTPEVRTKESPLVDLGLPFGTPLDGEVAR